MCVMGCSSAAKLPAALKKPVGKKVISRKPSASTSQTTAKKPAVHVMPITPNEGAQVLLNRSTALGAGDVYLRQQFGAMTFQKRSSDDVGTGIALKHRSVPILYSQKAPKHHRWRCNHQSYRQFSTAASTLTSTCKWQ